MLIHYQGGVDFTSRLSYLFKDVLLATKESPQSAERVGSVAGAHQAEACNKLSRLGRSSKFSVWCCVSAAGLHP